MKRRTFIAQGSILTTGLHFRKLLAFPSSNTEPGASLYPIFKNPDTIYRPFVRWWWNGDKIEKDELARELRLLKDAGIGGVEINPIKFPDRTNDLDKRSVPWLSDEWIELLQFAFNEARSLGLTCDLIVGSGWPYGAEWLEGEERSQVVVIGTKKLEGPLDYEVSLFDLFKEADPAISSPFPGRKMEMLSVTLTPSIINSINDVIDLSGQIVTGTIKCTIPKGNHVLYAMVKINGFMQVIQGAPGATGPVLNHYNKEAVKKYLTRMSDTIQKKIGPLSSHIRSLFTDSLELEGANWCEDMATEFKKRRGYDLIPFLPYILYKIVGMGNTLNYDHGAAFGEEFKQMIRRMRYDFELTKAELIKERFVDTFIDWCKENKVQSRMQAYGRGYFPLEGSFDADIPECETWIRAGLGTDMSETDYRIGRAYTMVNKYVSSAAHLKGKKHISCEELTNIHIVFNETLELMKVAGDQSIISGVTHPIFHGFNYSPPDAPFPGWVIYGTFINERNPWWPWFKLFTQYKARLSTILQQATMFADIAILLSPADLWSMYSAQNDPFPAVMYPEWQTLVWETIHQTGSGCDYISEKIIQDSTVKNGQLIYGERKYHSVFLPGSSTMEPFTLKRLNEFKNSGGQVVWIGNFPSIAPGWKDHEQRDKEVIDQLEIMGGSRFTKSPEPFNDPIVMEHKIWYIIMQARIPDPYARIESPNKFVTQIRYQSKDAEILLFINSNINESYKVKVTLTKSIYEGRQAWLWDAETGERFKIAMKDGAITLDMGPADLKLLVFDKEKKGNFYTSIPTEGRNAITIKEGWSVTGFHVDGSAIRKELDELKDLKEVKEWMNFGGNIVYKTNLVLDHSDRFEWLNLGKVYGVSELFINGESRGTKWYGRRIYGVKQYLKEGTNTIEIRVTTTLGNYLKSLKDNRVAQYWTNEGRTIQPLQSIGLAGPVTVY